MIVDVASTLYTFFSGFGITAYTTNNVPENAVLPYVTYDIAVGKTLSSAPIGARLWWEGTLPAALFEKADEIQSSIGTGIQLPCGNGYIWLYQGDPFVQPVSDEDDRLSTLYLNVTASFDLN
jgi:hypothetical protein